ncbi:MULTISPECIES: DUF397 domain-containing protein [Streptomyces]|uniref:DUF397 domain-containing protein n=1 Tax=Streptomyces TaxID=1883 RepID=UPI00163C7784|nr:MULTISPECIES: DUF397 domain-containing protein [Streptomyces]MBC2874562.1 DUF397 domain-containing protein [Streptomyces sp. TYQ1024]UBI36670.1 DUF397 domain-containing protein [Streptomyces mobaraensis]UKW29262.1 DUF397 domain-containing protein [Streptomyces sp. TYQ1024]
MNRPPWQRSSMCAGGGNNCLEIGAAKDGIALRESTDPEQVIRISPSAFRSLVREIKAGTPAWST